VSAGALKLGVVGMGYAGLCTAVCLARKFEVVGVDVDEARISQLNKGKAPIHEKGLPELLKSGIDGGTLAFSQNNDSLLKATVIFIAVGTPSRPDGSIDLSQVETASVMVGKQLASSKSKMLVVIKSTVTPGTAATVVKPLLEKESGKTCGDGFGLCSNPEFLREGQAIEDTLYPERIVLGPLDRSSALAVRSLYRRFYGPKSPPIVETTPENAELIKYASNTFLATKISFINFIARICETLPGADVGDVAFGMGLDPRIGSKYLQAGPGFGGACFPKDTKALNAFVEQRGVGSSLLRSVLEINDTQPDWIVSALERALGGIRGKEIALLGVAFKEESDDVRESRAIVLANKLLSGGAHVRITDPKATAGAQRELGRSAKYYETARGCIDGADAAVVMTAWNEFKKLKPRDFVTLMRTPVLFDARRLYDADKYRLAGLNYKAIGLGEPR
jgi:UDPglucose 6-dehydrogenase